MKSQSASSSFAGQLSQMFGISLAVPCISLLTSLTLPGMLIPTLWQDGNSVWAPQAEPSELSRPASPPRMIICPLCNTHSAHLILWLPSPKSLDAPWGSRVLFRGPFLKSPGNGALGKGTEKGTAPPAQPVVAMWVLFTLTALPRLRSKGAFPINVVRLLQTMSLCHQRRKMWERV